MRKNAFGKSRALNPYFKKKGRTDVFLVEALLIEEGETVYLIFESVSSPWKQGVWLMTDKGITVVGQKGKSVTLWESSAPKSVELLCHTSDRTLIFYNIWDSGRGLGFESQSMTSGFLIEETPTGFRYRCNDIGTDPDFSKFVFRIERRNKEVEK